MKTIIVNLHEGKNEHSYDMKRNEQSLIVLVASYLKNATVECSVFMQSAGADVRIIGIVLGQKNSVVRFNTSQIHTAPSATSNLLVKSILPEGANFSYEGTIRVEKNAQKTDAYQRNENLCIGPAIVQSKPLLEILANDVRCTHGAATSPIPTEQLWYMQTRGLSVEAAKRLYIEGYIAQAFEYITDTTEFDRVWKKIQSTL